MNVSDVVTHSVIAVSLIFVSPCAAEQPRTVTLLHEFGGGADDGQDPYSQRLASDGTRLFGMTTHGGDDHLGVVFAINLDGTGYAHLHEFSGGTTDGRDPYGAPTLGGSTLYGVTANGGDDNIGVIFKVNTDGAGYSVLHEFSGGANDGHDPVGCMVLEGSALYGMTRSGGSYNDGTIYTIGTDGSGFSVIHSFWGTSVDNGRYPAGSLVLGGATLFGMTQGGGEWDDGIIFKIGTDGSGFTVLRSFNVGADEGGFPSGSLVLGGSTLYGMTYGGGDSDFGVVFAIATDGSDYTHLHEFAGGADDGRWPYGSLTLSDSKLYGTTYAGGDSDKGVLLSVNTDGSGFALLHEFPGAAGGGNPYYGGPTIVGSAIYGMTFNGGTNYYGVLYRHDLAADPLIFADGFESGDASAWSSATSP